MRGDVTCHAGAANALFDAQPQSYGSKRSAARGKEDIGGRTGSHEPGASHVEVALQGGYGFAAKRHHSLLIALADDVDEAGVQVEVLKASVAQLGQAESGGE